MRILVTGATGFIGSAFCRLALSRGHQLAGLVLPGEVELVVSRCGPGVVAFSGTLESAPWTDIASFRADAVLHTAWITAPGIYLESPENERFLDASLKFLRGVQAAGTGYLVGLGTCVEYKMTGEKLSETSTPIEPTTTYARCKNELRLALETDAARHGFEFCWGRVFYPYGPGEHPSRLCTSLIQKLSGGEKVSLRTPNSTKDYIYIEDLAAAILATIERRVTGTINWGTGEGIRVREVAGEIARQLGRREAVATSDADGIRDPLDYVVADAARLRSIGWRPRFSISDGIRELCSALGR